MVKSPGEYVKSWYDDQKDLIETVLSDGVQEVRTGDVEFPVEGYQEVTGSRSLNTWYQNTTGKPLKVTILVAADNSSSAFRIDSLADVNSSQNNNTVSYFRVAYDAGEVGRATHTLLVPDQHYYQLRSFGDESINTWNEQEVGTA
jgi:hypothetical protein